MGGAMETVSSHGSSYSQNFLKFKPGMQPAYTTTVINSSNGTSCILPCGLAWLSGQRTVSSGVQWQ
jgi:hypothetical protein